MRTRPAMVVVVLLLLATTRPSLCYNLDVDLARVLSGENGTHFGYSVALWNDMNKNKK